MATYVDRAPVAHPNSQHGDPIAFDVGQVVDVLLGSLELPTANQLAAALSVWLQDQRFVLNCLANARELLGEQRRRVRAM